MDMIRLSTKFKIGQQYKHTKAKFVVGICQGDEILITIPLKELRDCYYGGGVAHFTLKNCRTGELFTTTSVTLRKMEECFELDECDG